MRLLDRMPTDVTKHPDLVYDVGMHRGEDTAFYLKKGCRVIGFEADPVLAAECRGRFAAAIADGRLVIVEGAICARSAAAAKVAFYRNPTTSVWGTVEPKWADRNARLGSPSERIEVPAVEFGDCLARFGVPHYLKIDIEGADLLCVEALSGATKCPDYLSIESNKTDFNALVREFDLLCGLGYTRFAVVQQARIHRQPFDGRTLAGEPLHHDFERGASGPFGKDLRVAYVSREEAIDRHRRIFAQYRRYGDDSTLGRTLWGRIQRKVAGRYFNWVLRQPLPGWYDTHAALSA
jgi:FkbM family methyltransferase